MCKQFWKFNFDCFTAYDVLLFTKIVVSFVDSVIHYNFRDSNIIHRWVTTHVVKWFLLNVVSLAYCCFTYVFHDVKIFNRNPQKLLRVQQWIWCAQPKGQTLLSPRGVGKDATFENFFKAEKRHPPSPVMKNNIFLWGTKKITKFMSSWVDYRWKSQK